MSGPRRIRDLPTGEPVQEVQSQAAISVAILAYAAGGAVIIVRSLLLAISIDRSYWVGDRVLGLTNIVFSPLSRLPAASTVIVGNLALIDLTAVVAVALVPVALIAFAGSRSP